jgi:hypothetical protein
MKLKWLEEVGERVAGIEKPEKCLETEGLKPVDPEKGEKVIGGLSGDLLGLFALMSRIKREGRAFVAAHEAEHDAGKETNASCERACVEKNRIHRQLDDLQDLFWAAVRREFGDFSDSDVGVRANGDVVAYKSPEPVEEVGEEEAERLARMLAGGVRIRRA